MGHSPISHSVSFSLVSNNNSALSNATVKRTHTYSHNLCNSYEREREGGGRVRERKNHLLQNRYVYMVYHVQWKEYNILSDMAVTC